MANLHTSLATSGPVQAHHIGQNTTYVSYALSSTASGSQTSVMCGLPAGAEVMDGWVGVGKWGTGGELVSAYVTIGGTNVGWLLTSVTGAGVTRFSRSSGENMSTALGLRLTASANVVVQPTALVGTGTGSVNISLMINYLRQKRGD